MAGAAPFMIRPDSRARATGLVAAFLGALLGAGAASRIAAPSPSPARDRTAVLLAINDVYRIEGLQEGTIGGLARVRALRKDSTPPRTGACWKPWAMPDPTW